MLFEYLYNLFYAKPKVMYLIEQNGVFPQRERPDWDTYFLNISGVVKTRSLDPKTQVGCVIVSLKDHRIISTGYNSVCAGANDSSIDWTNRDLAHLLVIHAESNAILYAQSKYEDAILYTTMSPCKDCIKLLSAAKIKKCIYKEEYRDIAQVRELCKFFGIELIKYSL